MYKVSTFKELQHELHNTSPQPNPNYYSILIDNFELVLRESALTSQGVVAHKLNMSTLKLSAYTVMFKELIQNGYTLVCLQSMPEDTILTSHSSNSTNSRTLNNVIE